MATRAGDLPLRKRAAFSLVLIVAVALLFEGGFRLVALLHGDRARLAAARDFFVGRRLAFFEPWPYVNFRSTHPPFDLYLRADDFTSSTDLTRRRTPRSIRIAFVGGSTTQGAHSRAGMGLGYPSSFPFFVEQRLRRAGLPVEVMNCGGAAWSSAENLVHYELSIQDYAPDWVVIHHGANDVKARLYPTFRTDYGHYRRPFALPTPTVVERAFAEHSDLYVWLLLRTRAVPQDVATLIDQPVPPANEQRLNPVGLEVFRRNTVNLIRIAEAGGARVLLTTESHDRRPRPGEEARHPVRSGLDEENETIRSLAREMALPLADTETALDYRASLFTDYVHVTEHGNRVKARLIIQALLRAGLRKSRGA